MPERLYRAGWRWPKPDGCVIVDRTSMWGNPFRVEGIRKLLARPASTDAECRQIATRLYAMWFTGGVLIPGYEVKQARVLHRWRELRGRDLACFCPLPEPGEPDYCHAAWLLGHVNRPEEEVTGDAR